MTQPLSPEVLAWLRQSALVNGLTYSRALLHLLERVEALEAAQQKPHQDKLDQLIALDRDDDAPTPEAAPVATDEELADCYADAAKVAILNAQIRAVYDLSRKHGAAAAQPAPPVAPAGGSVEAGRVVQWVLRELPSGTDPSYARHAIRAVARWIRSELISRSVADRLEQEADR